jgi:hypothetical protein
MAYYMLATVTSHRRFALEKEFRKEEDEADAEISQMKIVQS